MDRLLSSLRMSLRNIRMALFIEFGRGGGI
jgi:hypothetical protein